MMKVIVYTYWYEYMDDLAMEQEIIFIVYLLCFGNDIVT